MEKHPLSYLLAVLIIGVGGFAGSNLRFFFELVAPTTLVATFTVNVLGCTALGFLIYERRLNGLVGEHVYLVLATGFISSFTTYSTFVVDIVKSEPMVAMLYIVASYTVGFLAVFVGREGARWVARRQPEDAEPDVDEQAGESGMEVE